MAIVLEITTDLYGILPDLSYFFHKFETRQVPINGLFVSQDAHKQGFAPGGLLLSIVLLRTTSTRRKRCLFHQLLSLWVIFHSTNERSHWIEDNISNPNLNNSILLTLSSQGCFGSSQPGGGTNPTITFLLLGV